jgi:hypothetical protein
MERLPVLVLKIGQAHFWYWLVVDPERHELGEPGEELEEVFNRYLEGRDGRKLSVFHYTETHTEEEALAAVAALAVGWKGEPIT